MAGPSGGVPIVLNQDNLNELAARLGAKQRFRTGTVWFAEDFANGLSALSLSTGGNVSWSAARSIGSGYSGMVDITGAGIQGSISHQDGPFVISPSYNGRCGFEFSFSLTTATAMEVYLMQWYNINNQRQTAQVRIRDSSLAVYSRGNNVVLLPAVATDPAAPALMAGSATIPSLFHFVKLIVDWRRNQYIKLLLDDKEWDLRTLGLWPVVTTDIAAYVNSQMNATYLAAIGQAYFGHMILTVDEPE